MIGNLFLALRSTDFSLLTRNHTPKVFALSELKAFTGEKFIVAQMVHFFLNREEKIVGKGENAGYQHFLLFSQFFQKATFPGAFKVGNV